MYLKKVIPFALITLLFASCNVNNNDNDVEAPVNYEFTRNGESTVSFSGQTTRIQMGNELGSMMKNFDTATEQLLLQMYRNEAADGSDVAPFSGPDLNNATKSVKEKVAASQDYFSSNTTVSVEIKNLFESWMSAQVEEVFPARDQVAQAGIPGQLADGSSTRYVNAKGLEYDQMVIKGLIGALMTDQMLNNYLSTSVLDAGTNREDNTNGVLVDGKTYTNMEHKWDEAYGYVFGNSPDPANPILTLGQDDEFLNKYLNRVNNDEDFAGIAVEIFEAFKLGRAAIVAGDYELRDQQANIIRELISEIIGIRAVYYLQSAKIELSNETPSYGAAFHDLSEGYGFIFSLQFTRIPNTDSPYFTKAEVDAFLGQMTDGNGLWDINVQELDAISDQIAAEFDFTVSEAAPN